MTSNSSRKKISARLLRDDPRFIEPLKRRNAVAIPKDVLM
jgi:hypothetical protein